LHEKQAVLGLGPKLLGSSLPLVAKEILVNEFKEISNEEESA
jgi:hypothetical protein